MCFPQEKPSNRRKIRLCVSGKHKRGRQKAIVRLSARGKLSSVSTQLQEPTAYREKPSCAKTKLRVFLQGLRQKQHRWGAAWGIQKKFSQRFCIETVLTQKSSQGYCLEDVAILSQRKSSSREQPSYQLDFQQLGMAYSVAPICSSCIPHRIYVALTTFTESRPVN